MRIDDLLKYVADEPERIVTRTIWTMPAAAVNTGKPNGILMADFLAAQGRQAKQRPVRYRHILGGPLSQSAMEDWQCLHPSYPLPSDLREIILRCNGIHLWANAETGRSYSGLAPIEEWDLARIKMFGPGADKSLLDDLYLAISYHEEGAAYAALDVTSGRYFLMDSAGPVIPK